MDDIIVYMNPCAIKRYHMVVLRDNDGTLIGYYEKHEYRNRETVGLYQPKKQIIKGEKTL